MNSTETFDNGTVLTAVGMGVALFAVLSLSSPMSLGGYYLMQGNVGSSLISFGGSLAATGTAVGGYAAASSIGAAVAVGIGLCGVAAVGGLL
ncbi:MAG: hypothetical protein ABEI99_05680 [Halobaculum sp.]